MFAKILSAALIAVSLTDAACAKDLSAYEHGYLVAAFEKCDNVGFKDQDLKDSLDEKFGVRNVSVDGQNVHVSAISPDYDEGYIHALQMAKQSESERKVMCTTAIALSTVRGGWLEKVK